MPAEISRRPKTVINWQSDGSAARAGNIMSDEGPNYKILSFAGALALVSVSIVVLVIQFQRQGDTFGVVDDARGAIMDDQPKVVATGKIAVAPATEKPLVAETKPVQAGAAQPVKAAAAAPAKIADEKVVASAAIPKATSKGDAVVLGKSSPRWTGESTTQDLSGEAVNGSDPLALAPMEMPDSAPRPEAAPRNGNPAVAAIDKAAERAPAKAQLGMEIVKVRSSVSMRSRPADGSQIITTVPGGTEVQVADNCRQWCSVVYKGQTGFIYKSFLRL